MPEYRLTPAAERDLEKIWLYTRQQWGEEPADRYTAILANAFVIWRRRRKQCRSVTTSVEAIAAAALSDI